MAACLVAQSLLQAGYTSRFFIWLEGHHYRSKLIKFFGWSSSGSLSKRTSRGQVWKSKPHRVLGLRSHFLNTALPAHLSPKHCLNMAGRVTAENNLLVRTRGTAQKTRHTRAGTQRTAQRTSDVTPAPAERLAETKDSGPCAAFVSLLVGSVALRQ